MTQTASSIKNSWSLIAFARQFGKMQVGKFVNGETGEIFHSTIFSKGDTKTFVAFSPKLGELTSKEIAAQKDSLQVVLCKTKKGNDAYRLCKKGEPGEAWEDVDLGI